MADLWCEARCGIMDVNAGCRQTSSGAFGVRNASAAAKEQGWRVIDGEWVCPVCAALPSTPGGSMGCVGDVKPGAAK